MTNTPPPTSNNNDDAVNATEPETPVFDEVATEHPEVQDAAPDVVEPTSGQQDREQSASEQAAPASEPVPLVEPAAPEPVTASRLSTPTDGSSSSRPAEPVGAAQSQETHTDTAEASGYDEHIDEPVVAEERPAPAAAPAPTPMQTVYVAAPVAPKAKGNRGFGLLFAFLGLLVFTLLFVG